MPTNDWLIEEEMMSPKKRWEDVDEDEKDEEDEVQEDDLVD